MTSRNDAANFAIIHGSACTCGAALSTVHESEVSGREKSTALALASVTPNGPRARSASPRATIPTIPFQESEEGSSEPHLASAGRRWGGGGNHLRL